MALRHAASPAGGGLVVGAASSGGGCGGGCQDPRPFLSSSESSARPLALGPSLRGGQPRASHSVERAEVTTRAAKRVTAWSAVTGVA
eukprot:SM008008S22588  [mRNA]  locus=s8008:15:585:+ [translate_table: standard]